MNGYYLAPGVFYRRTPGAKTILYRTSSQEVFFFDGFVADFLDAVKCEHFPDDVRDTLERALGLFGYKDTVQQLLNDFTKLGVLVKQPVLEERTKTLEQDIKIQYYDALRALFGVQFEMTFRCNEHCRHCYCPRENDIENELTTDELKHVIDDLYEMQVVELTFTGGDLFMRSDAFEVMEYAHSLGFVIDIFTNGTLLKEDDFYRLKKLYPRSVHFSIYNYIPEKHDAFTQLPGSFKKTTDAIKKCKLLGIPVNIKVSLVEENREDIQGIIDLAKELGTTIQISMQITPTNQGDMQSTEHRLKNVEAYAEVMRKIDKNILLSCGGEFISTDCKPEDRSICGAGAYSLNVNPYGEVFPCNALLLSLGNVREKRISEIWNNSPTLEKVRSFRMDQLKGCEACGLKSQCDFCPGSAMQETGDPLTRYTEACTITEAKIKKDEGREKE